MNKKQGSAMVLAILLLSFFMALSLNMWYISQKKAQRAGDIVIGNRVLTDIDSSSTLGYYEFFLATEYMVNGFVTSPSAYTLSTTNGTIEYVTSTGAFTTTIEGISLESERQYFGAYLDTSGSALSTSANAILEEEVIDNHKLKSRRWKTSGTTGAAIIELWENTGNKSVGGYAIDINSLKVDSSLVTSSADFLLRVKTSGIHDIETDYIKTIYLDSSSNLKNQDISYKTTVKRKTTVSGDGTKYTITEDSIENITVELQ